MKLIAFEPRTEGCRASIVVGNSKKRARIYFDLEGVVHMEAIKGNCDDLDGRKIFFEIVSKVLAKEVASE